jgi:hypothetical protein
MDKWLKDILPDKNPYHNRRRDQMRKKKGGGSGIRVPVLSNEAKMQRPIVTKTKIIIETTKQT